MVLLGSRYLGQHKQILSQFSTVLVALDPDALTKAVKMKKDISNSKLLRLNNDLKYQRKDDINMMKRLGGM